MDVPLALSSHIKIDAGMLACVRRHAGVPSAVASYGLLSAVAPEITMTTSLEALEAEALKLAPADRSHLLERLIASLDPDPEVEAAWELEADRREAALDAGKVAEVPAQVALQRLRARTDQ